MRRFATAPMSTFESLFEQARAGSADLDDAEYPPHCEHRRGHVRFKLADAGGMIVHVRPGACHDDDFLLQILFQTGSCVFSRPADLGRFWTGPLAAAFGVTSPSTIVAALGATDSPPVDTEPPCQPVPATSDEARLSRPPAASDRTHEPPMPVLTSNVLTSAVLTSAVLAERLARVVLGQEHALERVASAVAAQLTKQHPTRPGSVLLIGPTGTGKTATIEALPAALADLGRDGAHVLRIDCGELTDSIQLTRLLGAPPGYVGHAATTPLLEALARPGCILLLDEIEKAHPDVHDLLLGLLDAGRLTSPSGEAIEAPHCVVALTSNLHVDRLAERLAPVAAGDRWAVQRVCREHLVDAGLPPELVGRIGAFAVFAPLDDEAHRHAAEGAVLALAREYGLSPTTVDPVVLDVVIDIAGETGIGVRALYHAARELLAEAFAAAVVDGVRGLVVITAGPPVEISRARRSSARHGA